MLNIIIFFIISIFIIYITFNAKLITFILLTLFSPVFNNNYKKIKNIGGGTYNKITDLELTTAIKNNNINEFARVLAYHNVVANDVNNTLNVDGTTTNLICRILLKCKEYNYTDDIAVKFIDIFDRHLLLTKTIFNWDILTNYKINYKKDEFKNRNITLMHLAMYFNYPKVMDIIYQKVLTSYEMEYNYNYAKAYIKLYMYIFNNIIIDKSSLDGDTKPYNILELCLLENKPIDHILLFIYDKFYDYSDAEKLVNTKYNFTQNDEITPLMRVSLLLDKKIYTIQTIRLLLALNADQYILSKYVAVDSKSNTLAYIENYPLYYAIETGKWDLVTILINHNIFTSDYINHDKNDDFDIIHTKLNTIKYTKKYNDITISRSIIHSLILRDDRKPYEIPIYDALYNLLGKEGLEAKDNNGNTALHLLLFKIAKLNKNTTNYNYCIQLSKELIFKYYHLLSIPNHNNRTPLSFIQNGVNLSNDLNIQTFIKYDDTNRYQIVSGRRFYKLQHIHDKTIIQKINKFNDYILDIDLYKQTLFILQKDHIKKDHNHNDTFDEYQEPSEDKYTVYLLKPKQKYNHTAKSVFDS